MTTPAAMTIDDKPDLRRLLTHEFPDVEHEYTERDAIFYALSIGLGGEPAEQTPVGVDEGEILALLGGKAGSRISGGLIHHCPQRWGIGDECKIPGRVEPDGAR